MSSSTAFRTPSASRPNPFSPKMGSPSSTWPIMANILRKKWKSWRAIRMRSLSKAFRPDRLSPWWMSEEWVTRNEKAPEGSSLHADRDRGRRSAWVGRAARLQDSRRHQFLRLRNPDYAREARARHHYGFSARGTAGRQLRNDCCAYGGGGYDGNHIVPRARRTGEC